MSRFFDRFQPWTLLALRIVLGCAMVSASWSKVVPHGGFHGNNTFAAIEKWNRYVLTLGMPAWLGTLAALLEFFGSFAILTGLFTRIFGGFLTVILLVGIWKVTWPDYGASKYPLTIATFALVAMAFGPGAASLDRRLGIE